MKNRTLIIAFNATIGFSFVFLFILPIVLFGPDFAKAWGFTAIPACAGFAMVLVTVNLVLRANSIMYAKIESHDWKGLADWLESRIVLPSGRVSRSPFVSLRVKLYVDSCMLLEDYIRIEKLEKQLASLGSSLLESQAYCFGLARFVENRVDEAADFFERWLDNKKTENRDWLRFSYGFCRVLQGRFYEAKSWLSESACSSDAVLASVGAYLLSTICPMLAGNESGSETSESGTRFPDKGTAQLVEETKDRLQKAFTGKKIEEEFERASGEMHVALYGKILVEARVWISGTGGDNVLFTG